MNKMLRVYVDLRDRIIMKGRIAFQNRAYAIQQGRDQSSPDVEAQIHYWLGRFEEDEKVIDKTIKALAKGEPIVRELVKIKGISFMLAAKLVSMIDISKADSISALWRYSGFAVIDGSAERKRKGERLHYNQRLKVVCYLIGASFIRTKAPYSKIYYDEKVKYQNKHSDWTPLHIHRAAMRKMIKIFLSHLWLKWRAMEGLPISQPYAIDQLGHDSFIAPEDFGWS